MTAVKPAGVWQFQRSATPPSRTVTSWDADGVPASVTTDWVANKRILTAGGQTTESRFAAGVHALTAVLWPGSTGAPDQTVGWDATAATPWAGLAGAWWGNASLSAQPTAHSLQTSGDLLSGRPGGLPAPFSGRLTGTLTVPSGASPTLGLDLTSAAACPAQPYAVGNPVGSMSVSYPAPVIAPIAGRIIVPDSLSRIDPATNGNCAGSWPVSLPFTYTFNGAVFPLLSARSAPRERSRGSASRTGRRRATAWPAHRW